MDHPEFKTFRAPVTLDLPGEAEGSVRALFSPFNVRDDVGDVVEPSFFKDGQPIPMSAWGHAWGELPPGRGIIHVTEPGAEFHGRFFLDTHSGREHYTTVRNLAELQEWSFGFKVTDARDGQFEGQPARFLRKGETYEASPVLVGANRGTRTLALKAAGLTDPRLDALFALFDARETHATWTPRYISDLPDSAFALIKPGGAKDDTGRTVPRDLRMLPHHDDAGAVDLAHLRAALARVHQPSTDLTDTQRTTARQHLETHARGADVGDHGQTGAELHAGRAISAARMAALRSMAGRLRDLGGMADQMTQLADEMDAMMADANPDAGKAALWEIEQSLLRLLAEEG